MSFPASSGSVVIVPPVQVWGEGHEPGLRVRVRDRFDLVVEAPPLLDDDDPRPGAGLGDRQVALSVRAVARERDHRAWHRARTPSVVSPDPRPDATFQAGREDVRWPRTRIRRRRSRRARVRPARSTTGRRCSTCASSSCRRARKQPGGSPSRSGSSRRSATPTAAARSSSPARRRSPSASWSGRARDPHVRRPGPRSHPRSRAVEPPGVRAPAPGHLGRRRRRRMERVGLAARRQGGREGDGLDRPRGRRPRRSPVDARLARFSALTCPDADRRRPILASGR